MSRCFVIQPFDGGVFDARYEDLIAPAVRDAGLEPYRVDRDPMVSIPIHDIEIGIRDATVCLADISLDNPNVWFELGFSIASQKEVVMVCSDARQTKFPFDVQHRSIIKYRTGAPRDFDNLKNQITSRIKAIISKEDTLKKTLDLTKLNKFDGLEAIEVTALASICENISSSEDCANSYQIQKDMERSGFTNIATSIALKLLSKRGFVQSYTKNDDEGYPYTAYDLQEPGWDWVIENKDKFVLSKRPKNKYDDLKDDTPF